MANKNLKQYSTKYIKLKKITGEGSEKDFYYYIPEKDFKKRGYTSFMSDDKLKFEEGQKLNVLWPNGKKSLEVIGIETIQVTIIHPYLLMNFNGIEARVYDFEKLRFLNSDLKYMFPIRGGKEKKIF